MISDTTLRTLFLAGGLILAGLGGFWIARLTEGSAPQTSETSASLEPDQVNVEASYLAVVGITTQAVGAGNLSANVLAPATIHATPSGEALVTAHATGTIIRLVKQLGDPVRAGETLALVESREAASMAADVTVTRSKAALARSSATREQELFDQRVTPRQELERAQAELAVADAEMRRAREAAAAAHVTPDGRIAVVSPIAGKVTSATAALGTFVQAETELFRIADPKLIQVEASVTAMDAQRIAVGDPARVMTSSGAILTATVRSTTPTVNEQTRAATVVLTLRGDYEPLSPGEIVQTEITPKSTLPNGVVVPEDAVQIVNGRNVVFVRNAAGFKVQPVTVGSRSAGRVAILSGLEPGATIATGNAFFLKAELNKGAGED